jgi:F-type H+-transporting ATPase subunit b
MISRALSGATLLAALCAPAVAVAQEHGEQTHGAQTAGHGEQAHGEQAHGAGEHGAAHGPEAINWTSFGGTRTDHAGAQKPNPPPFLATLINFGLLAAILFFAVKRAINPSLATRRAALESEIAEAQRLLSEAEAMHRDYSERIEKSRDEFAQLREDMLKSGKLEAQKIIDEARAKADRMQSEGQALIEQELRSLRADLTREAVEAAMKSAEQSVRQAVGSQDHTRLADNFLDSLDKVAASDRGAA